jgi:hypothetical protein
MAILPKVNLLKLTWPTHAAIEGTGNPAILLSAAHRKTGGFASPPRDGFALISYQH